jgi:hypothetical protein
MYLLQLLSETGSLAHHRAISGPASAGVSRPQINTNHVMGGNPWQLSRPADHTGGHGAVQTNSWNPVSGCRTANQMAFPDNLDIGRVFFRLAYYYY